MYDTEIQSVIDFIGNNNVQSIRLKEEGYKEGVWFVFEAGLLPPQNEINKVISDIINDRYIGISDDGYIYHSEKCKESEHDLDSSLLKCISNLKEEKYKIALWEKDKNSKPLAFSISHDISLSTFPNHPHINAGGRAENGYYIPESLCFISELDEIGEEYPFKIVNAIDKLRVWIFRHKIWLETISLGSPNWVGIDTPIADGEQFLFFRNPLLKCRCGRDKLYCECHLISDYNMCIISGKMPWGLRHTQFVKSSGQFDTKKFFDLSIEAISEKKKAWNKIKSSLNILSS